MIPTNEIFITIQPSEHQQDLRLAAHGEVTKVVYVVVFLDVLVPILYQQFVHLVNIVTASFTVF
jgi:hypothetical protein